MQTFFTGCVMSLDAAVRTPHVLHVQEETPLASILLVCRVWGEPLSQISESTQHLTEFGHITGGAQRRWNIGWKYIAPGAVIFTTASKSLPQRAPSSRFASATF